jgi:RHS repeat-associated protein
VIERFAHFRSNLRCALMAVQRGVAKTQPTHMWSGTLGNSRQSQVGTFKLVRQHLLTLADRGTHTRKLASAWVLSLLLGTTLHAATTVTSFTMSPSSVIGQSTQTTMQGTVTISRDPQDTGQVAVAMSCTGSACYSMTGIPSWVIVPVGSNVGTFTATAGMVTSAATGTLTATKTNSMSAGVTINPFLLTLTLSPGTLIGGSTQNTTGTVALNAAVLTQKNATIACSGSCNTLGSLPSVALIPAGTNTGTFSFWSAPVTSTQSATITATMSTSGSAGLTMSPPTLSLSVSPTTLLRGDPGSGTVSLGAATRYSATVNLTSAPVNAIVSLPYQVTIPAGQATSPSFTFSATSSATDQISASITATYSGQTATKGVTIEPVKDTDGKCGGDANAGYPINVMNGNTWISHSDYAIPGLGGGFRLERTWSSLWQSAQPIEVAGMFGHSWRSTVEERLQVISTNSLKYWRADCSAWMYSIVNGNWVQVMPPNEHSTLQFDSTPMLFTLTLADGTKKIFNNSGYLTGMIDRNGNQIAVAYDAQNRATQVTDAAGRVLTFNYPNSNSRQVSSIQDSVGVFATYTYSGTLLTQVAYSDGSKIVYNYDANNLMTSAVDKDGKVIESHTYDSSRRGLTSQKASGVELVTVSYPSYGNATITDSATHSSTFQYSAIGGRKFLTGFVGNGCGSCSLSANVNRQYDSSGNVTQETDALNRTTQYTYDSSGNVLTRTVQMGGGVQAVWSYTYNQLNEVLTATDPLGHTTTNTYDANGNLLSTTTPSPDGTAPGSTTSLTYDAKGQLTQITDPLGHHTTIAYTAVGLIQTITDAQNQVTTYQYDARGNRTAVIDPVNGSSHPTTFTYDAMNRLTAITYPDSSSVTFGYDSRGRRTSVTDQNLRTTTYIYDDADRLTSVTDSAQNTTSYAYDAEGSLISITDANHHTTSFAYDVSRRITQTTFPSNLSETYGYDAVGNLQSKTDRNSRTISYTYDALNRLLSKSTGVQYTYDLAGRSTQVSDATGNYGFTYDNMDRLIGTTTQYTFVPGAYSNSYTYDAGSNRTSLTAPDGSITTYGYDTLNRLNGLANSWAGSFGFGYDGLSRRTSLTRPNGVNTSYSYDSLSRILSVLHQTGSTTLDGASYTYDNAGNRTSKTNYLNNITEGYTYDNLYELTQVIQGVTTAESYTYDLVGNRLSSLGVPLYSYNSSNELTSSSLGGYTYDANGDTLSDAQGRSFTWDFENRLTQAVNPGVGTTTFKYDPFGRRIQKSGPLGTTNYLYDGARLMEEVDGSGNVLAKYTQSPRVDQPLSELRSGTTGYYEQDALGSVTSLSSATGALANTYSYDSFGRPTASTGTLVNPFQYTAREFDSETGLYYYRARYYDPSFGRFLSEDPRSRLTGRNLYRYVLNAPTLLRDASGGQEEGPDEEEAEEEILERERELDALEPVVPAPEPAWEKTLDKLSPDERAAVENGACSVDPNVDTAIALERFWLRLQGRAPVQSSPYNIVPRYDENGNIVGWTTYDAFGNRAYQYEIDPTSRHGPGYHSYDNSETGGTGNGPRSPHIPFNPPSCNSCKSK